eukprot:3741328-Rhodomonas_salina.2
MMLPGRHYHVRGVRARLGHPGQSRRSVPPSCACRPSARYHFKWHVALFKSRWTAGLRVVIGLGGAEESEVLRETYGRSRYAVSAIKEFVNWKGAYGVLEVVPTPTDSNAFVANLGTLYQKGPCDGGDWDSACEVCGTEIAYDG